MLYMLGVRTTLSLDDDVVAAARAIAERDHRTLGQVVSELARQSLTRRGPAVKSRNGIPVFQRPKGSKVVVTMELINELRDEEE